MTARFAGSRSLDERRRRRLAGEPDDASTTTTVDFADPVAAENGDEPAVAVADPGPPPSVLGETWLPQRAWKAWLLFLGVLLISAGSIVGGWFADREAEFLGPETVSLLGLESGRLVRGVGTTLLFLAGQLSLVVWWRRSRSRLDFNGRYDVWAWTAAGWFIFAIANGTQAHLAWTETVSLLWEPDFWNKTILSWFAPAVGVGGVLWMAARSDARRCRSGWWMLTLAGLCWVAAGAMVLGIGSVELGPLRELVTVSTTLAGHVLGFGGMYLHARFVTHVCCDPPVRRAKPKRAPKVKAPKEATAPETSTPTKSEATPAKSTTTSPKRSTPTRRQTKGTPEPTPAASTPKPTLAPKPATPAAEEAPASVPMSEKWTDSDTSDSDSEFDDGPPPEMLHGLSKRQKKKLRKEWRDRQRAARDAA